MKREKNTSLFKPQIFWGMGFLFSFFMNQTGFAQLEISGLSRFVYQKQELSGNILKNDSLSDRLTSGGYMLVDLRTDLTPFKWLKFNMDTRIKNRIGGFGGVGLEVLIRQIRLEALAGKYVKFTAGDIDVMGSPYGIYNQSEVYGQAESSIFVQRRKITEYENFNLNNHWRIRGVQVSSRVVGVTRDKEWTANGFLATNRDRNIWKSNLPFHLGLSSSFKNFQKSPFEISVEAFQFSENTQNQKSKVNLLGGKGNWWFISGGNWRLAINGMAGQSQGIRKAESTFETRDYYWNTGILIEKHHRKGWYHSLGINFKSTGAFFESPGSQSLRITGNARPDIFLQIDNNAQSRTANMLDRMGTETIQNQAISLFRRAYLPQYEWVMPYGEASPNRKGYQLGWALNKNSGYNLLRIDFKRLNEILGEGVLGKRIFNELKVGTNFNPLNLQNHILEFRASYRFQTSSRNGDLPTQLEVHQMDIGLNLNSESDGFDLLLGMKQIWANGNEVLARFNALNSISDYEPFSMNQTENLIGTGFRFHYQDQSFFLISGYFSRIHKKDSTTDFKINQLFTTFQYAF
jgi:hypothetical protein